VTLVSKVEPVDRLRLEVQSSPTHSIALVALSDDWRRAVTVDDDGVTKVWSLPPQGTSPAASQHQACNLSANVACPEVLQTVQTEVGGVAQAALSRDKRWLLTAGRVDGGFALRQVSGGGMAWYLAAPACANRAACEAAGSAWTPLPPIVRFALSPASADGKRRVAVIVQREDVPLPGATVSARSWSSIFICTVGLSPDCTHFDWYSHEALDPALGDTVAWSTNGSRIVLRVSISQTLLFDAGTLKLMQHWSLPSDATFAPDLQDSLYVEKGVAYRRSLAPDGRPVAAGPVPDGAIGLNLLADDRVRYLLRETVAPSSGESSSPPAATPASISMYELPAAGAAHAVLAGKLGLDSFDACALQISGSRQPVFFTRTLHWDPKLGTRSLSLAYLPDEIPAHLVLRHLEANPAGSARAFCSGLTAAHSSW
jgi:hypothetical protein